MNEPANEFDKIVHRKSIDPNLKIGKSRMKLVWEQRLRIKKRWKLLENPEFNQN